MEPFTTSRELWNPRISYKYGRTLRIQSVDSFIDWDEQFFSLDLKKKNRDQIQ